MSADISELLREAKAGAPPLRHTADDIVAAGRRRRERRRMAWAGGGAAAVVAVLAAAVVVPQVVAGGRGDRVAPGASAAPAPDSGAAAAPVSYPEALFAYGFKGYTVGKFEVSAPVLVTPGYQEAYVRKDGELLNLYGEGKKVVASTAGYSGMLTVYRPGVFKPTRFAKGEPVRVHGRPGFFATDVPYSTDPNEPHPRPALAWQYADDAWAVVSNLTPTVYSRADLISVAEGLAGSAAYPATLAFKAGWTPAGYVVTSAGATDDSPNGAPYMVSSVRLVTARPSYRDLTEPVDASHAGKPTIRIALYPKEFTDGSHQKPGSAAYCAAGNHDLCFRMTPDGKYLAEVVGSGSQTQEELKRILDNLVFAPVQDRSAWFPVTGAVPGATS
jgi:hypothetical protein